MQVLTQLGVLHKADAHALQSLDDGADIFLGQTEIRDGIHEAAAGFFHSVIDRNAVTGIAQVVSCRETRRTGANQGNLFAGFLFGGFIEHIRMRHDVIGHHTLYAVNGNGFIRGAAVALGLAGMRTDTAGHHGQRIGLHQNAGSTFHITGTVMRHIVRNIRPGRTFCRAGRGADLHAAEYGMIAIVSANSEALTAALAHAGKCAADLTGIAVKPAADILTEVAADGGAGADDRAGHAVGRLGNGLQAVLLKQFIVFNGIEGGHCADFDRAVLFLNVGGAGNVTQSDNGIGILQKQFILQNAQQISSAGHDSSLAGMLCL